MTRSHWGTDADKAAVAMKFTHWRKDSGYFYSYEEAELHCWEGTSLKCAEVFKQDVNCKKQIQK